MKSHKHLAVWIMIIANQILGYVWYAPWLFLNPWLAGQGKTMAQLNPGAPAPIIWSIVTSILAAYTISWLVNKLGARTFAQGAKLGVIFFTGFSLMDLGAHYQFLGMANSVTFIDLGFLLIWITFTSGILASWRKNRADNIVTL